MKIVSVAGKKNSGKTTLTVKIIKELTKRGYNVGSVKHSHHTMEMDKENTDTWKHKEAGSNVAVGIGSTTFFNIKKEMDLNRLLFLIKYMDDIDFVIIEGFKEYSYPKIITSPEIKDKYTIKEVDSFNLTQKEIGELADLIEIKGHDITDTLFANNCGFNSSENIASQIRNGNLKTEELDKVSCYLSVDENVVGLNRFVSDYIKQCITGIINTLNLKDYNVEHIGKIELLIPDEDTSQKAIAGNSTIKINNKNLEINEFTEKILTNTLTAMLKSLKTKDNIKTIFVKISNIDDGDLSNSDISLKTDNENVEMNNFTQNILKETIYAIVSSLKTDDEISEIEINVKE